MPKEAHTKAAEHHENAAKSHRTAAEHHGKGDHSKASEESTKARGRKPRMSIRTWRIIRASRRSK